LVVFAAGFAVSLCAGWISLPGLLYRTEIQPIRFNHQVHIGEKGNMGCADCHAFTPTGQFAGVPKVDGCATCHSEPLGTTAAERELVERYVKPNREPRWLVYARQPQNAYFSHAAHVTRAKLACERCHGQIGKSTALPLYQVNRITGYSRDVMGRPAGRWGLQRAGGMRMDDCVACHRERGLKHSCLDCHK
jgi:hypothetical protein